MHTYMICVYIYIYIYTYLLIMYLFLSLYIYIYIQRERERKLNKAAYNAVIKGWARRGDSGSAARWLSTFRKGGCSGNRV